MSEPRGRFPALAVSAIGVALAGVLYGVMQSDDPALPPPQEATEVGSPDAKVEAGSPAEANPEQGEAERPGPRGDSSAAGDESADAEPAARERGSSVDEENPFAAFLDAGLAITDEAMMQETMAAMDPASEDYDAIIEAHQLFQPFEATLLDADPLDPEAWKAALAEHRLRNQGVGRRASFLRRSGQPEAARDLMLEWGRLYGLYQAKAYGRAPAGEPVESGEFP